jgi:hypothetical protein
MDRKNVSATGMVIITGLLVIFLLSEKSWIIPVSIAFGAIFIFINPLATLIHKGWMTLAKVLGWIMSKLILSLLWYIILTPLAFIYRLTGHDELQLKKDKNSQFSDCPKEYSPADFEKPW